MFYLADLKQFAQTGRLRWIDDSNEMWIQQYPFDTWSHPIFSDTKIDVETAKRLKDSFDRNVTGTKKFADYDHGFDKAKGGKAAGEIKELKVIESPDDTFTQPGLWARVAFTEEAKKEIDSGEWNYWSTSHYDTWTHPHTGEKHQFVYDGGGVTNKPYVKGMVPLNFSDLGVSEAEAVALLEKEPPPVDNEGGEMEGNELEAKLREALGVDDKVDLVEHVKGIHDELEPLRTALKEHSERKAFAETFPEEYARLQRLEAESNENGAKMFSESYANRRFTMKEGEDDKALGYGLSALALDKVREFAKQFSENTATRDGFKDVLDTIMGAGGIVDYGTHGSSRENENEDDTQKQFNEKDAAKGNPREVRKIFFDKVKEIEKEDEVPFASALTLAAEKYPTLAKAYRESNPVLK